MSREIESVVNDVIKSAEKLTKECCDVSIVNAGLMNVGKSSLFNALVDQDGLFRVDDVPTTIVTQRVPLLEGISLIDTPGIDARDADTKEAHKAYRDADMILFVHNVNAGEMGMSELNAINSIKKYFPKEVEFWQRLIVVGSRKDLKPKDTADSLGKILEKIQNDIKVQCGGHDIPVFITSSARYWKGKVQKQDIFIKESGIEELKMFLLGRAEELKKSASQLREERLRASKSASIKKLEQSKNGQTAELEQKKKLHRDKSIKIDKELNRIRDSAETLWSSCQQCHNEM